VLNTNQSNFLGITYLDLLVWRFIYIGFINIFAISLGYTNIDKLFLQYRIDTSSTFALFLDLLFIGKR